MNDTKPTYEQLQDKLRRCLQKLGESDVRLGKTLGQLNAASCRAYEAEEDVRLLQTIRQIVANASPADRLEAFESIAELLEEDGL